MNKNAKSASQYGMFVVINTTAKGAVLAPLGGGSGGWRGISFDRLVIVDIMSML